MDGTWSIGLGWLLFGGSHLALALSPVREALVARLGKVGFMWTYIAIAWITFALLVASYARGLDAAGAGGHGPALVAALPGARAALMAVIVAGFVLMAGAVSPGGYWDSPAAVLMDGVRPPRGLGRVSRHPFFAGVVLVMGAHALLARDLAGVVFFGGFVALTVVGALHQGRKLRRRHGAPYDDYLRATSAVPFLAIARGRQRLAARELPWTAFAIGGAVALGLHAVHGSVLAYGGAPVIAALVGATALVGVISMRRRTKVSTPPGITALEDDK